MSPVLRGWISATAPIGLWAIHIVALASLSDPVCDRPELSWVQHALTALLLVLCIPFLLVLAQLWRQPADGVDDRQLRFVGALGLVLGVTSVVLILAEEAFALLVDACR
jgi:hypothetical protein